MGQIQGPAGPGPTSQQIVDAVDGTNRAFNRVEVGAAGTSGMLGSNAAAESIYLAPTDGAGGYRFSRKLMYENAGLGRWQAQGGLRSDGLLDTDYGVVPTVFANRAAAEGATVPNDVLVFGVLTPSGKLIHYSRSATSSGALQTDDGQWWVPAGFVTPHHWVENTGTADMAPGLQAAANFLSPSGSSADDAFDAGAPRLIDGLGEVLHVAAPTIVGNLTGGTGFTRGLKFDNMGVRLLPGFDNSDLVRVPGGSPVATAVSAGAFVFCDLKDEDADDENYRLIDLSFGNVWIDLNYVARAYGLYLENTYNTHLGRLHVFNPGRQGVCVGTSKSNDNNPRGYLTKNGALTWDRLEVAGYYEAFGGQDIREVIAGNQSLTSAGSVAVNGSDASGGEWVSPDGARWRFEATTAPTTTDLSGTTVTLTGFNDTQRTDPASATIELTQTGNQKGNRYQTDESDWRLAVVTGISVDGPVPDGLTIRSCPGTIGIDMHTADAKPQVTVMKVGLTDGGVVGSGHSSIWETVHCWSRRFTVQYNCAQMTIGDFYVDYTDLVLQCMDVQIHNCDLRAGPSRLIFDATENNETGEGIIIGQLDGGRPEEPAEVVYATRSGGGWADELRHIVMSPRNVQGLRGAYLGKNLVARDDFGGSSRSGLEVGAGEAPNGGPKGALVCDGVDFTILGSDQGGFLNYDEGLRWDAGNQRFIIGYPVDDVRLGRDAADGNGGRGVLGQSPDGTIWVFSPDNAGNWSSKPA